MQYSEMCIKTVRMKTRSIASMYQWQVMIYEQAAPTLSLSSIEHDLFTSYKASISGILGKPANGTLDFMY